MNECEFCGEDAKFEHHSYLYCSDCAEEAVTEGWLMIEDITESIKELKQHLEKTEK